jgi:hypothetical protein
MPSKGSKAPGPSRADRAAEETDYAAWKLAAVAGLTNRHDVKAGAIPDGVWKRLYIRASHRRRPRIRRSSSPITCVPPGFANNERRASVV